uniref:Uncharacterized protein n=1 Tax=viral metagenome TaxID=1070528 RepID=A0A6C0LKI8_9ZZZZ
MGNLFDEIKEDANKVQEKLLGPTYPYYKNIKSPSEIGMSSKGNISTLGKDIDGLIDYVEVLVAGKSKASATGGPLGNKFFLKTGAKCKANNIDGSDNEVDRYIYVDNVPNGTIPFISSGLGTNFTDFEGLIPGAMGNLSVLNPFAIMQAFMSGSTPPCQEITMETIDNKNNKSNETHYVTTTDIKNMNSCTFSNGTNPVSGKTCKSAFTTLNNNEVAFPEDPIVQLYFFSLTLVGIYIFMKLLEKARG